MKIKQNKKCNDFWKHETRMATFLNQKDLIGITRQGISS
jgi:hypothetical protein